jgi:uncharacterized phage protein (predicted DNA packaging)
MRYITVEDVKRHLYIDFEADDKIIADYIDASQEIIEKYLNVKLCDLVVDERLPYPVLQAIKIMTGNLYNNRESVAFNSVPYKVPFSFEYLIQPYKNYKRGTEI